MKLKNIDWDNLRPMRKLILRDIRRYGNICYVPLGKNKYALIDKDNFDLVSRFNWCLDSKGYARSACMVFGKMRQFFMHQMVCRGKVGQIVDHINKDTLDNRRSNLRLGDYIMNAENRSKKSHYKGKKTSSKHIGVDFCRNKRERKWRAYSRTSGDKKRAFLGYFNTELEAKKCCEAYAK